MKRALLLSVIWLLAVSALQAAPANANFASEGGVPFQLIFDGQPQTQASPHGVHIDRLTPGFHWAEFLISNGAGRVITLRARVVLDGGLENSYVLLAGPDSGVQLRKVGTVPIRRGYSIFDPAPYGAAPAPVGATSSRAAPADAVPGPPAPLLAAPKAEISVAPRPGDAAPAHLFAGLMAKDVRPAPSAVDPRNAGREYTGPQVVAPRQSVDN